MIWTRPQSRRAFVLSPGVIVGVDADDEVTVFDTARGRYWRGNATARQIVLLLERPATAVQIADSLHEQYGVDYERLLSDSFQVLAALKAAKLVRTARS